MSPTPTLSISPPPATEHSPFFTSYIANVKGDPVALMREQLESTHALLNSVPASLAGSRYAPGKWTVREVVGHMCDTERTWAYRAMRIARGEKTPAPSFDENAYVPAGNFERRTLPSLADELSIVRRGTIALFEGLDSEAGARIGVSLDGSPLSVRALAYIIPGHEHHHIEILTSRYGLG